MSRFSSSTRMIAVALAVVGWPALGLAQGAAGEGASQTGSGAATAAQDSGWTSDSEVPEAGERAEAVAQAPTEEDASPTQGEASPARPEAPASRELDGATYQIRLRDLEQRVDELKEQIRRSHTRLSLLSDTILAAGVGGARAEIVFQNELSSAFRLTEAVFVLDGAVQYRKQDETGTLAAQETIPIFSGSIPSGDHTLQVLIKLRGHGYGVFSYLRGYEVELRDAHSFTVTDGKLIEVKATAWERGGATTPLEERPAMRYTSNLRSLGDVPATPAKGGAGSSKGSGSGRVGGSVSVGGGN
ncbi:MAG: hypothetical protein GX607_16435 [Myxococcales bacterium]|jgi:hypothetical protein|nr:hypothetical protein [Myxococcales bacterium]